MPYNYLIIILQTKYYIYMWWSVDNKFLIVTSAGPIFHRIIETIFPYKCIWMFNCFSFWKYYTQHGLLCHKLGNHYSSEHNSLPYLKNCRNVVGSQLCSFFYKFALIYWSKRIEFIFFFEVVDVLFVFFLVSLNYSVWCWCPYQHLCIVASTKHVGGLGYSLLTNTSCMHFNAPHSNDIESSINFYIFPFLGLLKPWFAPTYKHHDFLDYLQMISQDVTFSLSYHRQNWEDQPHFVMHFTVY